MKTLTPTEDAKIRTVEITVNRRPVALDDKHVTGLEIKQAAIAQGVPIELSFQLSEKKGKHLKPVADTDTVAVKTGDEFRAVAGDDNS
ncbi:multiubiquitin domain-containing protein [Microbacterium sp. LTA6]|uniref:multiubiquitin domain-containing protein n=1 Tax=Microbacterium sp. LTA6 TaxID=3129771 RepID=UPI0032503FE7